MSNGELAVGFVGTGQMGAPMVDRLLAAGVGVRLFARRPEVVARFERLGATIARSAAALADGVEVLIMCPFSPAQVEEILVGSGGVLAALSPGAVVIQHTSYAVGVLGAVGSEERFAELALPYLRKDVALVEQTVADLGLDTGILGEIVRAGPATLVSTD